MNSKIINRSGNSHEKTTTTATAATIFTSTSTSSIAPYSKSVDAKYFARTFNDYNTSKLSPRDNSAVLRAVSASTSANNTFATATRLNKYRLQHPTTYKSHEMFEQQTQPQQESKQNTFGKYEKNFSSSCSSSSSNNGIGVGGSSIQANNSHTTCADDGENNQMVVITLNGTNAQQKQVNETDSDLIVCVKEE